MAIAEERPRPLHFRQPKGETAAAALLAGLGHVLSTLAIGAAVLTRHADVHRWHDHIAATDHPVLTGASPPHDHRHKTTGRTALLLILGSSPMVEGIPLFFYHKNGDYSVFTGFWYGSRGACVVEC